MSLGNNPIEVPKVFGIDIRIKEIDPATLYHPEKYDDQGNIIRYDTPEEREQYFQNWAGRKILRVIATCNGLQKAFEYAWDPATPIEEHLGYIFGKLTTSLCTRKPWLEKPKPFPPSEKKVSQDENEPTT